MTNELEAWVNESTENQRLYAQEGLILSVTEEIWGAMDRRGLNKQQLADRLGTGKSHVSQLLNGARNMTLRTLSDVAEALGQQIEIMFLNKEDEALWKPMDFIVRARPIEKALNKIAANDTWTEVLERSA